ncbi:MAG: SIMPL domain-containing protein [Chloroflexota bacterium]
MAEPIERMIVVSGEATVRRVPDLAVVSLSVSVQDRQTAPARDKANQRATAILARLRELGVPDADVQAPSLTVQPTYDYGRGTPKVTGYQAARPMTIRVRDIDLLGPILDALVDEGATQVHGTSMELADPEAASREALATAVGVARARAEALAAAAGLKLGSPRRIEEESDSSPSPFRGGMRMFQAAAEAAPTEIAAGEIEVTARLRAWFDLE